jgi:hypothetical protein
LLETHKVKQKKIRRMNNSFIFNDRNVGKLFVKKLSFKLPTIIAGGAQLEAYLGIYQKSK